MSFSIKLQCLNLFYKKLSPLPFRSLYCNNNTFECMLWGLCLKRMNEWMKWKLNTFWKREEKNITNYWGRKRSIVHLWRKTENPTREKYTKNRESREIFCSVWVRMSSLGFYDHELEDAWIWRHREYEILTLISPVKNMDHIQDILPSIALTTST